MILDGGIFIGRDPTQEIGGGDPLAALAPLGIGAALAASFKAAYFDVAEGNAELIAACRASGGRLVPVAILNPVAYDLDGDMLERLAAEGVKVIGLFPKFQFDAWGWDNHVVRAIARKAAALGLAVQAGLMTAAELGRCAPTIAGEGARLLVRWMKGSGYNATADMVAVGRDFGSVLFDVSTTTQSGGIAFLAERLGAERLFIASGWPLTLPSPAHLVLRAERLSEADRALIQGGTLCRALGLDLPVAACTDLPQDLWVRPKIDTHWHTSGWNIVEPRIGVEAMRADMDALNYRFAVTSSIRALNYDLPAGNAETAAFCGADPRVRGYVVINPRRLDESLAEIERWRDDPRFVGLKTIQDFYGLDLDAPEYEPLLARAAELDWPLMCHLGGLARTAARHPEITFIAAHGTWRLREIAPYANIYCDIATSTALRQQVDLVEAVRLLGEDRVLFSCDGQLMHPAWTLGKLLDSGFSEAVLDKIFVANALRALPRLTGNR
jgi:predicted TIM-barrel fold metal-dependent hydrolase